MSKLLELHREILMMRRWLKKFATATGGMFCEHGSFPDDSSKRFTDWLVEAFPDPADRAGAIMLMRDAGINWTVFLRPDDPTDDDRWFKDCMLEVAHAMGGRMGEGHTGRARSKFPLESET